MRLRFLGLGWICAGALTLVSSGARAESEPLPPCTSPDGFPGAPTPGFDHGPSIPANAPAIPLLPGSGVPDGASFTTGMGDPVAASLRLDEVLPWVMLVPEDRLPPADTLVVTFEDACRGELGGEPAELSREFIITDEAPLPETLGAVVFDKSIIGEGCETLRAIQIDVTLPQEFVPWRGSLTGTLAAIPTGEAANDPFYQGTSVTAPYLLTHLQQQDVDPVADALTLSYYINPQCTNQNLSSFLAPGEYELEFTAHIAGSETIEPALGVLVVPESACVPCQDAEDPEQGVTEEAEEEEEGPVPEDSGALPPDEGEVGCRLGGSGDLPPLSLLLIVLAARRRPAAAAPGSTRAVH